MKFCVFFLQYSLPFIISSYYFSLQLKDKGIIDKPIINVALKLESDK